MEQETGEAAAPAPHTAEVEEATRSPPKLLAPMPLPHQQSLKHIALQCELELGDFLYPSLYL